jgi:2-dehydro-3-deoxygluconokinase
MQDADLIYYSGITLAILDPLSRETLFEALNNARAAGKTVAFDTNLRPKLWASAEEMKKTIMMAASKSDIVLPSFEDEAAWFGDRNSLETLDRYERVGARHIVVKNSAEPVMFRQGRERGEIEVDPATDIVDTTAAGDSFNAGVLAEIMRHGDMAKGISLGCRLAGHVVRHKGALVPVEPS